MLDLQNKYENDKLILENKQIRLENEKQTYFYLFLFVFILGWASSLSFWLGKGIEQNCCVMSKLLEIIMQLLIDMLVELQNWRMRAYRNVRLKEEIGILNRKILCLIAENKRVCENSSVDALFVLEELKQGNLIISNMTIAERQHIFDFLDLVHANFITRLKQEFDLTKMNYCWLRC